MRFTTIAYVLFLVIASYVLAACAPGESVQKTYQESPLSSESKRVRARLALESPSIFVRVNHGEATEAAAYYKRIQTRLGLTLTDGSNVPRANLTELIEYFGYPGITAGDLEKIESTTLMPTSPAEFDVLVKLTQDPPSFSNGIKLSMLQDDNILVSRFFAPKIVDYTKSAPYVPGWRKLAKLRAQIGSRAEGAGMASIYILFNYVRADVTGSPFENNISKNNQVIVVPKAFDGKTEDAAYFMVFQQGPQYLLGLALDNVAFDLPTGPTSATYFIPGSCAQCHGHDRSGNSGPRPADGVFRFARLNYLDTDQWHDAVQFDFKNQVGAPTQNSVVFDGGSNVASPSYKRAIDILRKLNQGVQLQNAGIDATDFKVAAVEKWLSNHAANDAPIPQEQRILGVGSTAWNPQNSDERELLTFLNHYCFRCHSSIRYNVFDKEGVSGASAGIEGRLQRAQSDPRYMPNGRVLDPKEKDRIIELVRKIFP